MYRYTSCGLPNVYLKNGYTQRKTPYGDTVSISDLEGLHDAIANVIVNRPAPLSGAEMRFLRNELELSQQSLAQMLGVDGQSIARWEKEHHANATGDRLVRIIYARTKWGDKKLAPLIDLLKSIDVKQAAERLVLKEKGKIWQGELKAA